MHINMKYYIVTIGAIFIALGIGILVGFNLNYDQELSKQQSEVINDLDRRFEDLKKTNDTLEANLSNINGNYGKAIEFINQNSSKIIADELLEKNIGIISTNENNDYTAEISDIISKSSGNVAFDIILKNNIYNDEKLKEAAKKIGVQINNTEDMISYIVDAVKSEDSVSKLTYLQELEMIKINALDEDYSKFDSVVLAGGSNDKDGETQFTKIDKVLIPKLKEGNRYVVGVQKNDAKFSYVDLYSKEKVATVDNVDEGIGRLSLVLLLKEGNIVGNFGRLDTAESVIPYKK